MLNPTCALCGEQYDDLTHYACHKIVEALLCAEEKAVACSSCHSEMTFYRATEEPLKDRYYCHNPHCQYFMERNRINAAYAEVVDDRSST